MKTEHAVGLGALVGILATLFFDVAKDLLGTGNLVTGFLVLVLLVLLVLGYKWLETKDEHHEG